MLIISNLNQNLRDQYFMMFILQMEHNDFIIKYIFNGSAGTRLEIFSLRASKHNL